jgi:hypothetical protein
MPNVIFQSKPIFPSTSVPDPPAPSPIRCNVTVVAVAPPAPKNENAVIAMLPVPATSSYVISPTIVVRTQLPPGVTCISGGHAVASVLAVSPPFEDSIVNHPVNANRYWDASAGCSAEPPSTAATAAATPLVLNAFE